MTTHVTAVSSNSLAAGQGMKQHYQLCYTDCSPPDSMMTSCSATAAAMLLLRNVEKDVEQTPLSGNGNSNTSYENHLQDIATFNASDDVIAIGATKAELKPMPQCPDTLLSALNSNSSGRLLTPTHTKSLYRDTNVSSTTSSTFSASGFTDISSCSPVNTCNQRSSSLPCAQCGHAISDRYYLVAVGRAWHLEGCLRCSQCQQSLDSHGSCFLRDGKIYCKDDYARRWAFDQRNTSSPSMHLGVTTSSLCSSCRCPLSSGELVMRAKQFVYHVACFVCSMCGRRLHTGQQYALMTTGNTCDVTPHIYCREDYELVLLAGGPTLVRGFGTDTAFPVAPGTTQKPSSQVFEQDGEQDGDRRRCTVVLTKARQRKRKVTSSRINEGSAAQSEAVTMTSPEADTENVFGMIGDADVTDNKSTPEVTITPINGGHQHHQQSRTHPLPHQHLLEHATMSQHHHQQLQAARQKRLRTSFKHHQLRIMKTYFALNHNPDAKDLKQLAQKTGLGKRILQVWFQNARAKYRRSVARQELDVRSSDGASGLAPCHQQTSDSATVADRHNKLQLSGLTTKTSTSPMLLFDGGADECGYGGRCSSSSLTAARQYQAECNAADMLDHMASTTSVGSSMSEFQNSSLCSDDHVL